MINNLLPLTSGTEQAMGAGSWISIILVYGVFILVLWLIFFRPQSKKRKKEEAMRKSAQIGDEITTIGGVCGEVVEINDDENTFVLKTGTSDGEYSYLKFDKQAIYQTGAKPEPAAPAAPVAAAAPAEEKKADEEKPAEEKTEEEENK